MVKADLVQRVMEAAPVARPAARQAVDALFESLGAALERGEQVVLRRFGRLLVVPRKTGVARNPRTNEPLGIPRGRVVRFRPATGSPQLPRYGLRGARPVPYHSRTAVH